MENDWEDDFKNIISGLDMDNLDEFLPEHITIEEIRRTILGLNEAAMYLGAVSCDLDDDNPLPIPADAVLFIRELLDLTSALSDILSEHDCEEFGCHEDDDE